MVQGQQAPPGKTWTMKTFLLMEAVEEGAGAFGLGSSNSRSVSVFGSSFEHMGLAHFLLFCRILGVLATRRELYEGSGKTYGCILKNDQSLLNLVENPFHPFRNPSEFKLA